MSNSTNGNSIRNNLSSEYEKTPGFFTWDLSEAIGLQMDTIDGKIAEIENEIDVNNLAGDDLTKFVQQRKGVIRKVATSAVCALTVNGTGSITAGDIFETDNGVQFAADVDSTITYTGVIAVTAIIAGNSGIVGAGSIVDMPVTIPGINSCTNEEASTGGYDEEDDDALRTRYFSKLQDPVTSSNKNAYKEWAIDISGVGGAEVFATEDSVEGDNCVDVVIIDANMQAADSTLISTVQAYIDPSHNGKGEGAAPIGAHCYVTSATELVINASVKLTLESGAVQADVEALIKTAIKNYLKLIAFQGTSVSYGKVGNCIIDSDGVQDYENLLVNGATANIPVSSRYVAVLGTVTFTYV